mmetsp:Transcript_6967/g.10629  ORF Transcript_6967/g.10629 Transcript_6967/m.10629 type:complete len:334 (-) Transcript_6967:781-1782(-)
MSVDVLKEGHLLKKNKLGLKWDKRYFVLTKGAKLRYYYDKPQSKSSSTWFKEQFSVKGEYSMLGARVVRLNKEECGQQFGFGIVPKGVLRMITLGCESEKDRTKWMESISELAAVNLTGTIHTKRGTTSILEGFLKKQGGKVKNWKVRYFVLQHHAICYFATKLDAKYLDKITLSGGAKVSKAPLDQLPGSEFPFYVQSLHKDSRRYILSTDSEEGRETWMKAIQQVSDVNIRSTPALESFRRSVATLSVATSPDRKEGWLKKLGGLGIGGGSWQERYFRIDGETKRLNWFKAATDSKVQGFIDLTPSTKVVPDDEGKKKRSFVFSITVEFLH